MIAVSIILTMQIKQLPGDQNFVSFIGEKTYKRDNKI